MECNICKPLKSDEIDFTQVHSLPDPIPTIEKTNYKKFSDLYNTITTEDHRPSLLNQKKKKANSMGFSPSSQFAKNVGIVIECCECNKWRVLYSKTKLNAIEVSTLKRYFDTIQYACGDTFENAENESSDSEHDDSDNIGDLFKKVKINDSLTCNLPMEVPYYSSGLFENICFQCGNIPEENDESINSVSIDDGYYYYCNECNSSVSDKRKRSKDAKLQQNKKKRI